MIGRLKNQDVIIGPAASGSGDAAGAKTMRGTLTSG